MKRVVNWFFSAISTLLLIALAVLGWLKWLFSAVFIIGSIAFGYAGFKILTRNSSKNKHAPTSLALAFISIAIFLLVLSVLSILGIIQISLE